VVPVDFNLAPAEVLWNPTVDGAGTVTVLSTVFNRSVHSASVGICQPKGHIFRLSVAAYQLYK
jgi:hypothetical protein